MTTITLLLSTIVYYVKIIIVIQTIVNINIKICLIVLNTNDIIRFIKIEIKTQFMTNEKCIDDKLSSEIKF